MNLMMLYRKYLRKYFLFRFVARQLKKLIKINDPFIQEILFKFVCYAENENNIFFSRNVILEGHSRIAISEEGVATFLVNDKNFFFGLKKYYAQEELLNVCKVQQSGFIKIPDKPLDIKLYGRWVSALNPASENWMHWLSECLPNIINANVESADGILYDEGIPETALEVLRVLSGGKPLKAIRAGMRVQVEELVENSNRSSWSLFWPRYPKNRLNGVFNFDCESLQYLRQELLSYYSLFANGGKKLYVERDSHFRHIINKVSLREFLIDVGFEVISPGAMAFKEQMESFSQASVLVVQAGAGAANMIFMPKKARVICLAASAEYINYDYFSSFAKCFGLEFEYHLGDVHKPEKYDETCLMDERHPTNCNFYCDIKVLNRMLNRPLKNPANSMQMV